MKTSAATTPTKIAAIHSIESMKRSINLEITPSPRSRPEAYTFCGNSQGYPTATGPREPDFWRVGAHGLTCRAARTGGQ